MLYFSSKRFGNSVRASVFKIVYYSFIVYSNGIHYCGKTFDIDPENGLNNVLQMMLNAMMHSECTDFLTTTTSNKGNGFRLGKVFGVGSQIELHIPRDRQSQFIPTILALFRD